jgi:hypothetical protein
LTWYGRIEDNNASLPGVVWAKIGAADNSSAPINVLPIMVANFVFIVLLFEFLIIDSNVLAHRVVTHCQISKVDNDLAEPAIFNPELVFNNR